jgi:CheY-like chemotaxis protein
MERELLGVSVLVVKHDDVLREAFRLTLRYLGATVFEAPKGHQALAQVAVAKPQVILSSRVQNPALVGDHRQRLKADGFGLFPSSP